MSSNNKPTIISVGFNNEINFARVIAIFNPATVAGKRLLLEARNDNSVLDVTMGRKVRSVILFDNKTVMTSALNPQTITQRGNELHEEEDI